MIRKYHARCGAGEKIENHRFKVLPIAIMNIVGDISIPHGYIGIPWQAILKLYEPFTEYQILKNTYNANVKELIKKYMDISSNLTSSDLKRFLTLINEQPENVNPELVDELVRIAEDITKGKKIVGTGTISEDGKVGEIGSVSYKIASAAKAKADIFLCPKENYEEAKEYAKKHNLKIKIKAVSTFEEAINYLKTI